ncbi:hypothetical protein ACFSJW_07525 [Flavobacterium artemisiae]|uniref:Uncharacterized protein n=1 Tax=Flavobacterium artemisiae TaxID=2126556 RepID=A0ABW4HCK1_9FLAO
MKIITLILMILTLNISSAQIIFINKPSVQYFEKIQVSKLPDQQSNCGGHIFFFSDSSYFNTYVKTKVKNLIQKTSSNYYLSKFKKNKYIYTNYNYSVINTNYFENKVKGTFTDTTNIQISADRHKKQWSWKHFKFKSKFLSNDIIYTGKIYSVNRLKSDSLNSKLVLQCSNSTIKIFYNNAPYFNFDSADTAYNIVYNFSDDSFEKIKISSKINFNNPGIEITKNSKNIIFYFPLFL